MPQTLSDCIRRLRNDLNEPAYPTLPGSTSNNPPARFWSDTELTDWLNDGLRDVARRAEELITYDTTIFVGPYTPQPGSSAPTYPLPTDVIRIYRIEFVPLGSINQTYPLQASTQWEMDQIWGTYQQNPSSYPQFWVTRGYPGGTGRNQFVLQVYPVPSQGGSFNLIYYRQPTRIGDPVQNTSNYQVTLDITEGWEDLVIRYAKFKALQKRRDENWKDAKDDYEDKVTELIEVTRRYSDQATFITQGTIYMPAWLTTPDW